MNWFLREIFGPVLPIMPVEDVDEAIAYVNAQFVAPYI
jgi:acyl-CoA reductase-like NAD-dependent aldehyde dehydrogenase